MPDMSKDERQWYQQHLQDCKAQLDQGRETLATMGVMLFDSDSITHGIETLAEQHKAVYDDYTAERIRADQLWDIAHALRAALARLLDSQRGLNLQEWQAATAQGREALAKANGAEPET